MIEPLNHIICFNIWFFLRWIFNDRVTFILHYFRALYLILIFNLTNWFVFVEFCQHFILNINHINQAFTSQWCQLKYIIAWSGTNVGNNITMLVSILCSNMDVFSSCSRSDYPAIPCLETPWYDQFFVPYSIFQYHSNHLFKSACSIWESILRNAFV